MTIHTSRKRSWWAGGLTLAAGLMWAGQAFAADTIIVARPQDADSLDTHRVSTTISLQAMTQIYGNMVHMDAEANIVGGLAESYSLSEDGKTYTFKMRPGGVKCHDGTVFDAAAAQWNFDRVADPNTASPNASSYGDIVGTRVEGDNVIVELGAAYSALPAFLAGPLAHFMCPSTIQGEDVNPVGTGPWKFVNWDRNNEMVFERYEDHVNFHPMIENPGPPHMKRLIFKTITEGPARMAALKTGEVTFAEPSLQDAAQMKDDPEYIVYTSPHSGQQAYIAFAHKIPPFDDVRARRAVGYAVDRNVFANIAFEGLVEATNCPIAPGLFGADQAKCQEWGTSYDSEKAKALLAEVGFGPDNPLEVIMSVSALQGWDESHVIMQQQLAEVGIKAKMEVRQFAAWVDHMSIVNDQTEGTPVVWTMGMSGMDPDYLVFLWQRPGYANQGIDDKVLDQMLREQRAVSGAARHEKLLEIQKFLLENAYEIPTWSPGWFWLQASKSNVKGFKQVHMVTPIFNDVTIEE
jgi:ABC-type transport system substrate-binding protein